MQVSMIRPNITPNQKKALAIATVIALVFGAYFLRGYFNLIVTSAVLAYLFAPLYRSLCKRRSNASAATLTLLASVGIVLVPILLFSFFAVNQLQEISRYIGDQLAGMELGSLGSNAIDAVNRFLQHTPFNHVVLTEDAVAAGLKTLVSNFGGAILNYFSGFIGSIVSIFSGAIIYIFLFLSLLRNGPKLVAMFRELNPLGYEVSDMYVSRASAMVQGTVRGQFTIAFVQGLIGAATISLAGLHGSFFILLFVLTALSIIPLGGGVLVIPIGILMMLFGNVVGGIIVIAGHFLITTNIDNILRPRLVPEEARLDAALMLVSVFSGIAMFGFLGIVIGPTIMVLIVTTINVYLAVYRDYATEAEEEKKKKSFFHRLMHRKKRA